ncbi:MAG: hypothetical protein ACP5NB_07715 [Chloroflexia bacterium]
MSTEEGLPGRWVEMRLFPAWRGAGLGPALGWLAGALSSGGPFWRWPYPAWLLLGLFLCTALWGRLWARMGEKPDPFVAGPRPAQEGRPHFLLPYTVPGSLSASWEEALRRVLSLLRRRLASPGGDLLEVFGLVLLLLLAAGLFGERALLMAVAGLALLGLRRLVRGRPAATALLLPLAGMSWPWWLGQVLWAWLDGVSLLLSLLWGLAYAGWARSQDPSAAGRPHLLETDLPQAAVLSFFFLSARPIPGAMLTLLLLGQVLLQARLLRSGRREELAPRTWPLAAAGVLLTGLTLGGWLG